MGGIYSLNEQELTNFPPVVFLLQFAALHTI